MVDADNAPLIGATITDAENPTVGTVTGIDGTFTLTANPNGRLLVECLGFKSQTIAVAGKTRFEIKLLPDITMIDELVVVGYGTMRKSDLTGAVSAVNSEVFEDRPVSSIGQA